MPHGRSGATGPVESVLAALNDEQRQAVTAEGGPLCVLAGAGSGKTRVLTSRIAHRALTGDADPRRVLAVTFTRKAAGELRDRLRRLGLRDDVPAGTFHAIAYAQLRSWWASRDRRPPELLDRKVGFVARLLQKGGGLRAADAVTEIEWAKARLISPEEYPAAAVRADRQVPGSGEAVAAVYGRYEEAKRARNLIDFDDMLARCRDALSADEEFAAAQRWRFRHLFVDEFQDVNPLQLSLLRAWLGDRSDLCVVGDPNQAIYGWNGADASFITSFPQVFPGGRVLELRRNHRSTPQILRAAAAALGQDRPLVAVRPDGPPPVVVAYPTDRAEADGIARAARDAKGPHGRWSDQAVLARTHAQIPLLEEALRRARIPYRTRAGSGLLEQPEVRSVLRSLTRERGDLRTALADLEQSAGHAGPPVHDPLETGDEPPAMDDRDANVAAVVALGYEYLSVEPSGTAAGFVQWLRATVARDPADSIADAVELVTFHAAKGLEWPVVHVAGLEHGLVPISRARTPEALAEERRLLYVALTRAERQLRCSWAAERTFGSKVSDRRPSPFLVEVERAVAGLAPAPPADPAERVREARRSLRRAEPATAGPDPVLEALRSWRSVTARAAGVAEHAVLADDALAAVAAARPHHTGQLEGIPGLGPVKRVRYGDALVRVVVEAGGIDLREPAGGGPAGQPRGPRRSRTSKR